MPILLNYLECSGYLDDATNKPSREVTATKCEFNSCMRAANYDAVN